MQSDKSPAITTLVCVASVLRAVLCLFPQGSLWSPAIQQLKTFSLMRTLHVTDYKDGHAQEAAEPTQNLSHSGKDQFSSSVCMVQHLGRLSNSRSWFSFAVYQRIFTSCGFAFIFFLPLKLLSSPLIFAWSFCNVRLWYISFHIPAVESYAEFHLFLMPLLVVILYAKLGVQNVPYFESSENNTRIFPFVFAQW